MGFLSKTKQQKMDILQKVQENLALTQQNITLLANQNQDSLAANQETLQATLKSIETMLEKAPANTQEAKEHSPDEKKRAAYALNCCTISVSQIVDYDDIYILEQEYESILNNLNLENMPKDDALLDIYKQLLDTITFFRIQEGDKAMLEQEYQHKVKNAIWSAVPQISLAGLATNPIGAAINLATQVGIGYMNYRREKAEIQSEQEIQKWQLTRSAMEQFNGLRRELFTTAWRLADKYEFADNLRITEQQIAVFNKILLDTDDLRRYERLDYIKNSFEAYTPFLYHLGNAAYKASQNMSEKDAARFQEIAHKNYTDYIKNTNDAKLNLFRQDHIRAACALELFELKGKQKCDTYLLDMAKDAAGSNFDVLEICAMSYLQVGETGKAKEILRMLVNENYNAVVNGQILSSIYVSEYIKSSDETDDRNQSRHNYETLSDRINPAYLFHLPEENEISCVNTDMLEKNFLESQQKCLQNKYDYLIDTMVRQFAIKFNQAVPAPDPSVNYSDWYYSDDPNAIEERANGIRSLFKRNRQAFYISSLEFVVPNMLEVLNAFCIAIESLPGIDGKMFVLRLTNQITLNKEKLLDVLNNVGKRTFEEKDIDKLFSLSFRFFSDNPLGEANSEIRRYVASLKDMKEISNAELRLAKYSAKQNINIPAFEVSSTVITLPYSNNGTYISLDLLGADAKKTQAAINKIDKMKDAIKTHLVNHPLLSPNAKRYELLENGTGEYGSYMSRNKELKYIGGTIFFVINDTSKLKNEDWIFTSNGIRRYTGRGLTAKVHPFVRYSEVKFADHGFSVGKHNLSHKEINQNELSALIEKLKKIENESNS